VASADVEGNLEVRRTHYFALMGWTQKRKARPLGLRDLRLHRGSAQRSVQAVGQRLARRWGRNRREL